MEKCGKVLFGLIKLCEQAPVMFEEYEQALNFVALFIDIRDHIIALPIDFALAGYVQPCHSALQPHELHRNHSPYPPIMLSRLTQK